MANYYEGVLRWLRSALNLADTGEFVMPQGRSIALVLLRSMFNLAIKWGVGGINKNPNKDVPLVPDTKKMERFLSEEVAQRLYKAVLAPVFLEENCVCSSF